MPLLPGKSYSCCGVYLKVLKVFMKRWFSELSDIVKSLVEWKPYFDFDRQNGSSSLSFEEHFWLMQNPLGAPQIC